MVVQHLQINKWHKHINRVKNRNHKVISTDAEKVFDRGPKLFMKNPPKIRIEGTLF